MFIIYLVSEWYQQKLNEVEPPSSPSRNVGNHQPTKGRDQGSALEIENRPNVYSLKVSVHLRYAIQDMPKFKYKISTTGSYS